MPEEKKRAAVRARKTNERLAKGSRRRNRTGNGARRQNDTAPPAPYGMRPALSITVQIPPLKLPKKTKGAAPSNRHRQFMRPRILVPALLVALALLVIAMPSHRPPQKAASAQPGERTTPDFTALTPSTTQVSAQKYDGKRNLVTFTTTFSGSRITVSEQPLPPNFAKDKTTIQEAADSINAKQKIDTAHGTIYIATNDKSNDQMAIHATSTVLLFIHADSKLDDASWKAFVELLKTQ